jgi:predicted class III extradiol MEMO1 family dioxygenase
MGPPLLMDGIAVYQELRATGKFEEMSLSVDEEEHSMEMHLPYLAKVFKGYVCVNPSFS